MGELAHYIGADLDVPAGDIGVGGREIGYLFGQYKRITGRYEPGVITGQGPGEGRLAGPHRGDRVRPVFFVEEMLHATGDILEGSRVVVSGSGNVALYAIEKAAQFGGTVVACSDSAGYVLDEKGIDLELLPGAEGDPAGPPRRLRPARAPHAALAVADRTVWEVPCDLALPCATQNEIGGAEAAALVARRLRRGGREGANMPTTPEAVRILGRAGVTFAPGKAANAGGVATSALEMQQNASRDSWSFEHTEERLASHHARHPRPLPEHCRPVRQPGRLLSGGQHRRIHPGGRRDVGPRGDLGTCSQPAPWDVYT